ncbi:MAG: hypothetical protein ACI87A_003444, partial [Planctomycetota bacterium]
MQLLEQVDEGEDKDPDQVDEVPEQAHQFDGTIRAIALGVLALQRAFEDAAQVDHAAQHVQSVEACHRVKGRTKEPVDPDTVVKGIDEADAVTHQVYVLVDLNSEESNASENGQAEP